MLGYFSGVSLGFFVVSPKPQQSSLIPLAARITWVQNPSFRVQRRAANWAQPEACIWTRGAHQLEGRIEWTHNTLWFVERGSFMRLRMESPHRITRAAEWGTSWTRGLLGLADELTRPAETRSCLGWFLDRWHCDPTAGMASFLLVSLAHKNSILRLIQIRILLIFSCISLPIWISICT